MRDVVDRGASIWEITRGPVITKVRAYCFDQTFMALSKGCCFIGLQLLVRYDVANQVVFRAG